MEKYFECDAAGLLHEVVKVDSKRHFHRVSGVIRVLFTADEERELAEVHARAAAEDAAAKSQTVSEKLAAAGISLDELKKELGLT